jgi:hypothetical protein
MNISFDRAKWTPPSNKEELDTDKTNHNTKIQKTEGD